MTRKIVGAAAALSAFALLAAAVGCGAGGGGRTAETPLELGRQQLDRGTQVLNLSSRARGRTGLGLPHLLRIGITVPDGWFNYDGWAMSKGHLWRAPVFVMLWDVARVYPTPCRWKGKPLVDPGTGVTGLAAALARQPLRHATTPAAAALDGHRALYLELSVPTGVRFDECDGGTFESWTANGWASDRSEQKPGQVDRIWIVEVDGQRLVVDASYLPGATPSDRAELARVVSSIRFLDCTPLKVKSGRRCYPLGV